MSDNSTGASSAFGEIKFVSIARVSDGNVLLAIPSDKTKKAYAEEVCYKYSINFISRY